MVGFLSDLVFDLGEVTGGDWDIRCTPLVRLLLYVHVVDLLSALGGFRPKSLRRDEVFLVLRPRRRHGGQSAGPRHRVISVTQRRFCVI